MKDQETVQQFIERRARELSFAKIAAELGVAKSTLINWSHEHQHLIQNLRAIGWEEFQDRTLTSKEERIKALADQLRRLEMPQTRIRRAKRIIPLSKQAMDNQRLPRQDESRETNDPMAMKPFKFLGLK